MEIKPDTRLLTQAGDYQKIIEPEKCRSTQWAHSHGRWERYPI